MIVRNESQARLIKMTVEHMLAGSPAITQPPQVCFDCLLQFRGLGELGVQFGAETRRRGGGEIVDDAVEAFFECRGSEG